MNNPISSHSQLSIAPLGAGDLIDRAVRLYRKYFWTFVLIAAPPVVVGTLFSIGWTMLGRTLFFVGTSYDPAEMLSFQIFTWLGGIIIWLVETVAILTVMGGASRNFIRHLLFDEPISFGETYRNTRKRISGLIVASIVIAIVLGIFGLTIFYFGLIIAALLIAGVFLVFQSVFPLAVIFSVIIAVATIILTAWVFFLVASRFAYIPQVMLVEGQGFFPALSRSLSLASGNVKRFAALFTFTTVVTYSALALLYIPLGWYAWASGVEVLFSADVVPAWYQIANQLVGQISFILLMPVWMIGLCLLYVDERVRHEGYDIELMAARRLGDIPNVPQEYLNPLQPALSKTPLAEQTLGQMPPRDSKITTLGLN
jgi:hypothetical protein